MNHATFEIEQDSCPSNPRDEFDHLSTFYGPRNSDYLIGGKKDQEYGRYALEELMNDFRKQGAVIVEFQADAGTCYAVVERDQLQNEYIKYGYSMRKALYWARRCAKGEIAEWLAYCNGEVYGYIIKDDEGETLDSCWGFYGYEYCKEEAESSAAFYNSQFEQEEKKLEERIQLAANL